MAEWRETGTEEGTAAKSDFRRPPNQKPHIRGKMGGQWGGSGMPRSKGKPREEFLEAEIFGTTTDGTKGNSTGRRKALGGRDRSQHMAGTFIFCFRLSAYTSLYFI